MNTPIINLKKHNSTICDFYLPTVQVYPSLQSSSAPNKDLKITKRQGAILGGNTHEFIRLLKLTFISCVYLNIGPLMATKLLGFRF